MRGFRLRSKTAVRNRPRAFPLDWRSSQVRRWARLSENPPSRCVCAPRTARHFCSGSSTRTAKNSGAALSKPGSRLVIPIECPAKGKTTYYVYFDNPAAGELADFLSVRDRHRQRRRRSRRGRNAVRVAARPAGRTSTGPRGRLTKCIRANGRSRRSSPRTLRQAGSRRVSTASPSSAARGMFCAAGSKGKTSRATWDTTATSEPGQNR